METMLIRAWASKARLPEQAWEAAARLGAALSGLGERDWGLVDAAIDMSNASHVGQLRKSGEPYVIHPLEVAAKAAGMGLDAEAVCAALLHDVVEDTDTTEEQIEALFGKPVAAMVQALTKIEAINTAGAMGEKTAKAETLRKMMLAMSRDIRVILIKLCDRAHNLSTVAALAPNKRRAMANETREIYAPIASRLGLDALWSELMDLSFQASNPWRSAVISKAIEKASAHRRHHIEAAAERARVALQGQGIEAEVSGRRKRAHSIYAKMREKKLRFQQVHDREGLRVVVDTKAQCYLALGALHELWRPMPGHFKDYIALPKINGYQSLHTALVNEQGDSMEAQVRTRQMHARAEDGLASHWVYKAKGEPELAKGEWAWLQSLLDIQTTAHAEDYLEHIKTDLFSDEVYVFTPSGEAVALPRGATALDFAFGVHSDLGMSAVSAVVDGEPSPLSRRLRSGEIVSVRKGDQVQAKPMWLAFAKTGRAKSHIRAHLRSQELPKAVEMGAELVGQVLGQLGAPASLMDRAEAWRKCAKRFGGGRDDMLAQVGRGALPALALAQSLAKGSKAAKEGSGLRPIMIGGEESETVTLARCCSPLPPQPIMGALTQDAGLAVHRRDCPMMSKALAKGDVVALAWEEAALMQSFSASIKVKAKNERGMLGRLAQLVARMDADVNNVRIADNGVGERRAVIDLDIQVRSKFHLDRVVEALAKDPGVIGVL
jgi:guanosine-3',5'-bis(diphosphate) 3'-pyrophosphohydrolase